MAASLPSSYQIETKESESGSFPMDVASFLLRDCPSSEKRVWSSLRRRADGILREGDDWDRSKRLKEDSLLLLRGFESAACTLSQLSENIESALQGAKMLAKPPTLTEIFHTRELREQKEEDEKNEKKKPLKRKFELASSSCVHDQGDKSKGDSLVDNYKSPADEKLKKAKNLAASMATKAASFVRELKSLKSDLSSQQERCVLLEEENKRLRNGFAKGIEPDEDDLVRLQLETLLAEKSRLANENANLLRENQCLNQLVTYHQLTTQDLTESYEEAIRGMCLGFTSPIAEADDRNLGDESVRQTLIRHIDFSNPLDGCFQQEQL